MFAPFFELAPRQNRHFFPAARAKARSARRRSAAPKQGCPHRPKGPKHRWPHEKTAPRRTISRRTRKQKACKRPTERSCLGYVVHVFRLMGVEGALLRHPLWQPHHAGTPEPACANRARRQQPEPHRSLDNAASRTLLPPGWLRRHLRSTRSSRRGAPPASPPPAGRSASSR